MRRMTCAAAAAFALAAAGACATRSAACPAPLAPYVRTTLYFDRSNTPDPHKPYSEEEWARFVTDVLVRHLPGGGTITDTTGWWRRPDGSTFRGIGRALVVLAPDGEAAPHRQAVARVIDDIKTRYGHQLVIREEGRVCAAF